MQDGAPPDHTSPLSADECSSDRSKVSREEVVIRKPEQIA